MCQCLEALKARLLSPSSSQQHNRFRDVLLDSSDFARGIPVRGRGHREGCRESRYSNLPGLTLDFVAKRWIATQARVVNTVGDHTVVIHTQGGSGEQHAQPEIVVLGVPQTWVEDRSLRQRRSPEGRGGAAQEVSAHEELEEQRVLCR